MAVIGDGMLIGTGRLPLPPLALGEIEVHAATSVTGEWCGVAFDFAQAERRSRR